MADKRTTPEAHHGPRRKKRAAPTIDLTAREVDSGPPDPPPHSAGERSKPDSKPDPKPDPMREFLSTAGAAGTNGTGGKAWAWTRANLSGPALAGGIAGAAIVLLVMFALWLTGLVPIRYAGSTAMRARVAGLEMQLHDLQNRPALAADSKAIDAMSERLAKIDQSIAKLPASDPVVAERLAATDNAMKSLGLALTVFNRRSDDIAGNAALARERAEAAEKAVTELRASVLAVAKNASAGMAPAELDALQKRLAALEQSAKTARDQIAKTSTTDTAARLALSAAGLRDAVVNGAPFAVELNEVKTLGADEKVLAPLEPFAAAGVPNEKALAHELSGLVVAMVKVAGAQAPAGGFFGRLQANAGKLVRIRPVDAPPGDDPSAVLARIEIAAAKADIAGALSDLGRLSAAARAPAQAWIAKAQARQAALAAARQFAAAAVRALGPR